MNGSWFPLLRTLTILFASIMLIKYFVFLVTAPFYKIKEQRRMIRMLKSPDLRHRYKRYHPLVTVIVPARNEEIGILKTIRSVLCNKYSKLELIVVNDGSTDRTHQVVDKFIRSGEATSLNPNASLHYFAKTGGGKGTALNHGIEAAAGEIIMTVDADSILECEAITNLVHYFADDRIDAVVGNVKVANNQSFVGLLQRLEYLFGFYFKRAHAVLNAEYIFGGACAAFRRNKTFDTLGLFDVSTKTEDIELSVRIRYNGLHCAYAEDVICYTEGASDFKGLINQRLRWKKGRFDTFIKYRRLFFSLDKKHNRFLSWFILPYALFSEIQLLFEPIGITLLVSYSFIANDYISLLLGVGFIFISYLVTALLNQQKVSLTTLLLFPFTWPWFYLLVWIEFLALTKSLVMLLRGDEIVWQRWERHGIEVQNEAS